MEAVDILAALILAFTYEQDKYIIKNVSFLFPSFLNTWFYIKLIQW